jgi:HYDIN/CFA65/VesB-like, Ig-like domain/Cep192 domain 4/Abnormal spindle-like microcephaly-assoc'd, ASPM-SPD-2-Hydin
VKRLNSPWTCAGCGLVLLSVVLFAASASGQLAVNPSTVNFGSVPVGNSVSQSVLLTNNGSSNLTISQATISGTEFSNSGLSMPLTLAPGQAVRLTATFTAQVGGSASGSLAVGYSVPKIKTHGKGSPSSIGATTISLTGTGAAPGQLTANASSLNFANVQVGGSVTLTDSLTNTGGASVTISQATVAGTGFSISGLNAPLTLNPGASVTFSAVFAPQSAGSVSGGVSVSSDASIPTVTIALSGTGTALGQLTLTPTALGFGSVTVGSNASQASSLSASGASVTVSSASLSSAEFSLTGISFPLTIAAGQSVPFTVTFAPQTSGSASAVLSLTSNASNSPAESLSGTGVAPPQHSVSLSWTDEGSGIVGYNVYRGSASGGPYAKITSALETPAAYSDNSVAAGQTYYYVTTAVDGTGTESAYSNEAQAVVPSP